jgi:EmrB/QacA subfamily drug resistance transporter
MAFIDGTVVNVSLAAFQSSLGATVSQVQWVVEGYALFLAALLLPGGSLGDIYGRRKVFSTGVLIFGVASAWCGLAGDIHQLLIARALQGIGGALLVPGSLALISASFSSTERGTAIGTWSGFTAITASVGPVLGGWLIQHASWRWVFFINLPVAAAVLAITSFRVPESRDPERSHSDLDWAGAALAIAGLGGIVFALTEPAYALVAGPDGAIALAAFVFVEKRSPSPMVSPGLLRSRNFLGANLLTLFLYAALSGLLFFLPLYLIQIQKYSATAAGASLLPLVLLMSVLSRWSGGLVARYGARLPLVAGPIFATAGFIVFAIPGIGGSYWTTFFPAAIVLGVGMAITVAPLTTTVMNAVAQEHAGAASGINNAVSRVAGLLAVAVFGFLLIAIFNRNLDQRLNILSVTSGVRHQVDSQRSKLAAIETTDPQVRDAIAQSFLAGFRGVMYLAAALSAVSSMSAALLIDRPSQR